MPAWIPIAMAAGQTLFGEQQKQEGMRQQAIQQAMQKRRGQVMQPAQNQGMDIGSVASLGGQIAGSVAGGSGSQAKTQAIQNRMDTANAGQVLQQGQEALKLQPLEIQQKYGPILDQAKKRYEQDQMTKRQMKGF